MNNTEICVIGEYPCTVKQFLSLDCRTPLEGSCLTWTVGLPWRAGLHWTAGWQDFHGSKDFPEQDLTGWQA